MTMRHEYEHGRLLFEIDYTVTNGEIELEDTVECVGCLRKERSKHGGFPIVRVDDYDLREALGEVESERLSDPQFVRWLKGEIEKAASGHNDYLKAVAGGF